MPTHHGSSLVELFVRENGTEKKLVFSGDVGRKFLPILRDPEYIEEADVLIPNPHTATGCTTISRRQREAQAGHYEAYRRGGKIIVPAFSVGRTQDLVYAIHQLVNDKAIPDLPVYVDSPLSVNVTQIFRMHPECFDRETLAFLYEGEDPFGFSG